ncbi:S1C family serine protease [Granulicoccus sp. GXG6511]|uniref:S1C family serine protease n=1 Tax=Granulicoccus sp. GXG6511 TaxID=3381351 RepID=UPI003D7DE64D
MSRIRPGIAAATAAFALILTGCGAPGLAPGPTEQTPGALGAAPTPDTTRSPETQTARPATAAVPDWAEVAARVAPGVVAVNVQAGSAAGQGSGVVIDDQGHIVTNHHVVAAGGRGGEVTVTLADNRVYPARVVGTDPASDLAVLIAEGADLTPVPIGDDDELRVGDPVLAVGNPLGLAGTVTSGMVSAMDRPVTTTQGGGAGGGEPVVTNAIQTDAAINPGNSGGALVNSAGELVGINSSIATMGQQSGNIGIGFAITATQVRNITDQLIENGEARHSFLGVAVTDLVAQVDGDRVRAAGVARVDEGTPAARAGLQRGDAVTEIDGEDIDSGLALTAQVRERRPGTEVTLGVARDGSLTEVRVTLGTRP